MVLFIILDNDIMWHISNTLLAATDDVIDILRSARDLNLMVYRYIGGPVKAPGLLILHKSSLTAQ